jgi:tetratricopeptide (TPR) repeat protein
LVSCASGAPALETPLPAENPSVHTGPGAVPQSAGESGGNAGSRGLVEEIHGLTESGALASLLRALQLIRERDLGASEFGRVMNGVNAALIRHIYPDAAAQLPPVDLPQTHVYARILRDVERGNYTAAPPSSADYLEHVLPFLALLSENRQDRLLAALPDLEKARILRPNAVLAPYFSGVVFEKTGRFDAAEAAYTAANTVSECYPAMMGIIRMMRLSGRQKEALTLLAELAIRYPDNLGIKRQLAIAYYEREAWSQAEPVVAEVLQGNSRDGDFILMRAHILVEQGRFAQAQAPLDLYASINPQNRLYLFLRARLQAEGYRNRDSALGYLRSILRVSPGDEEALVYAARLLMESPRPTDQNEGRALMSRLLQSVNPSLTVLGLGLRDAISREAWQEAQGMVKRLLAERRSRQDLLDACTVESGLGNHARALAYARELYEQDPLHDEGAAAYVSALISNGRREDALRIIESRLRALSGGPAKSRYFYLRSRLRTNGEAALGDLRSSLFEDPRNLDALIGMFDTYHRLKDERRAVYYLKQALAIAPENPRLKRYEQEYAALLR